ncbi:hypothetical protein D3C72_1440590 [compost metagenome]
MYCSPAASDQIHNCASQLAGAAPSSTAWLPGCLPRHAMASIRRRSRAGSLTKSTNPTPSGPASLSRLARLMLAVPASSPAIIRRLMPDASARFVWLRPACLRSRRRLAPTCVRTSGVELVMCSILLIISSYSAFR